MTIKYIPLFANGKLTEEDYSVVQRRLVVCEAKLSTIPQFSKLQGVDVLIESAPRPDLLPIGGLASKHRIVITIDPAQPCYRDLENQLLPKTFFHELHHALRIQATETKTDWTLEDLLALEGLAQVFELETGHKTSQYSVNLSKEELLSASRRAINAIKKKTAYNCSGWFFGTENFPKAKQQFKRWTGYSLGFAIVSAWLKNNNKSEDRKYTTATEAVSMASSQILSSWLKDGKKFLTPWLEEDFPGLKAQAERPYSAHQRDAFPTASTTPT